MLSLYCTAGAANVSSKASINIGFSSGPASSSLAKAGAMGAVG